MEAKAGNKAAASGQGRRVEPRLWEAAHWYRQLAESSNAAFLPLFADESRYLVLMGGSGSGKSMFAARKILERAVSEGGHRFLVCRKTGNTLEESCIGLLERQLALYYPGEAYQFSRTRRKLSLANGSEILFRGLDDTEKLKSIYGITGIWIEEASEITEQDFNQLDIRMRGKSPGYKQILITFNPVSALHWLKRRFWDRKDPRARTHHSTYRDNRFLDEDYVRTLEGYRDTDEYYHTVYTLGLWGSTGKSIFQTGRILARLENLPPPLATGYFQYTVEGGVMEDIRWQEDADGFIRLYRQPEPGVPYVIGGDTAGAGSDCFVAQVLDNRDGSQAATLRQPFDEDLYAHQVYCLGRYYNDALVGIETNFSSYPVLTLERLRYPNQYVREETDAFTHRPRQSFGFVTSSKTRPLILAELVRAVREDIAVVRDETTLYEMLSFVRDESYRPAAEAGAHDDCVMALAIAHYIRPQQRYHKSPDDRARARWSRDMREDWRLASPEERRYLEEKWSASSGSGPAG